MSISTIAAEQNPWWKRASARASDRDAARRNFQRQIADFVRHEGDDRRRSLVVLGARQVGKTFALRQLIDELLEEGWPPANITYFDFSDDRITNEVSPRDVVEVKPAGLVDGLRRLLLFDEIHRASRWSDWLKHIADFEPSLRVVATGSIAGALRDGARESGQGRWDELVVGSLTFAEHVRLLGALTRQPETTIAFRRPAEMERYLELGGFPEHIREEDYARVRARIRRDVSDRAIARDLAHFGLDVEGARRLFVYLAAQSGCEFSSLKRARDLGVDERSVKSWVQHLSDAQLIVPLSQYARGSKVLRTKKKIYAADHGLVNAFAASADRRYDSDIRGRAVETTVFRHLREAFGDPAHSVQYYRASDGLEADFVIDRTPEPVVIEVTSSSDVRADKVGRLREVGRRLGTNRLIVVYTGVGTEYRDGVHHLPLEQFLLEPAGAGDLGG